MWIVAHRRGVDQIEETLAKMLSKDVEQVSLPFIKVMSLQWLSRHYQELDEQPTLIVIDEAHHAVAKTYAEVMMPIPKPRSWA